MKLSSPFVPFLSRLSRLSLLSLLLLLCNINHTHAVLSDNATVHSPPSNTGNATRYVILDNDWVSTGFIPFLLARDAGMEVLALASDTCNSWVKQASLHALALLEVGGLDHCIPVVEGSTYPLVQTVKRFRLWEQLWGKLEYEGVFAVGGDPSQILKSDFIEGFPNTTVLPDYSAAQYMIEQVHKYPGQVSIYSAVSATFPPPQWS